MPIIKNAATEIARSLHKRDPSTYEDFKRKYHFNKYLTKREIRSIDNYVMKYLPNAKWGRSHDDSDGELWIIESVDFLFGIKGLEPEKVLGYLASFCNDKMTPRTWPKDSEKWFRKMRKCFVSLYAYFRWENKLDDNLIMLQSGLTRKEFNRLYELFEEHVFRFDEYCGPKRSKRIYIEPLTLVAPQIGYERDHATLEQADLDLFYDAAYYAIVDEYKGRLNQGAWKCFVHFLCFFHFENRKGDESYVDVAERLRQKIKKRIKSPLTIPNLIRKARARKIEITNSRVDYQTGRVIWWGRKRKPPKHKKSK